MERQQEEKASRRESASAKNKQNTNKQDKKSAGKGGSRITGAGGRPAATGSRVSFQSTNSSTSSRRGSGTATSLETGVNNVKDRDRRVSTGSMQGNIGAPTSGRKKSIPTGK